MDFDLLDEVHNFFYREHFYHASKSFDLVLGCTMSWKVLDTVVDVKNLRSISNDSSVQ